MVVNPATIRSWRTLGSPKD